MWTEEEIGSLNEYQSDPMTPSIVCPHGHGALLATFTGWTCLRCGYSYPHALQELRDGTWRDARIGQDGRAKRRTIDGRAAILFNATRLEQ